jgi:preprotein translocase subunit SecE
VARNRKRAKDRRTRRPPQGPDSQQGLPTATHEPSRALESAENGAAEPLEAEDSAEPLEAEDNLVLEPEDSDPADPLRHAAPEAELAEAQMAYGRPEEPEPEDEADEEEFEHEVEESIEETPRGTGYDGEGAAVPARRGRGAPRAHGAAVAERRPSMFARLVGFLQGSWRELQRVQWPDRRQVMQATGVVIGFVIVAAAFLGLADLVASKIVTFILK